MAAGRPSKYKKKYCKDLIEHCSKEGRSFASFCALIGIGRATFNRWTEDHEEFREARNTAGEIQQEFFEKLALSSAAGTKSGQKMNSSMIQFILSRRFKDYRNQQHIESNTTLKAAVESKVEATMIPADQEEQEEELLRRAERIKLRKEREAKANGKD